MSDKKNVLSDKQKHQLNKWLESGDVPEVIYSKYAYACDAASISLGCTVTYSNMKSAEEATGISLVKAKEPKSAKDVASLESVIEEHKIALLDFMAWCRYPIPDKLAESYIKPSANKPLFCHKHG